jgi:hypothetical protein
VQPSGTGVFNPFLRVQHTPTEQGYNTDGTPAPFDDKPPALYQHSLQQSTLASFVINGVEYYKFILDSNQSGTSDHTLSVDQLQFYTSNNPAQTTTTFNPDGTLAFDASTKLAYNLNISGLTSYSIYTKATGSGIADMYAYIPVSYFDQSAQYVILYFFAGTEFASTGGFEEWSAALGPRAPHSVPETGTTLVLAAFSFSLLLLLHRLILRRASQHRG